MVIVSGRGQNTNMESMNKSYIITKQLKVDFEFALMARNHKESTYHADPQKMELWSEVSSDRFRLPK